MNTGEAVLAFLQGYDLKPDGGAGKWRCNSPLRPGSNAHGFTLLIHADGEHGAWDDKSGGESGSLYDLAKRLNIPTPTDTKGERVAVGNSKRAYKNLAEYAAFKGVPEETFIHALWSREPLTYDKRPALKFPTKGGDRYRFVDGLLPAFKSEKGYKACWYGLKTAAEFARKHQYPLILCNGEPSVVVAAYFELPACAITGGETPTIPAPLLAELKQIWTGEILIALDCDAAGRKAAAGKAGILRKVGYSVKVLDLGLGDKGDLADFCKLHTDKALDALLKLAQDTPKTSEKGSNSSAGQTIAPIPIVKRSERLTHYIDNLTNFEAPRAAGVPFPLRVLHKFGGLALAIKPGKVIGIVGVSGGGKTSLLEMMVDGWLRYQVPCIAWSPEWMPDEFIERAVQRYGGPRTDEVHRHEIFIDEQQRGIKDGFGVELSPAQIQAASAAVGVLRQFKSEVGYLDMPMLTAGYLKDALPVTLAGLDFKPRVLVIDYVQLLASLEPGNTSMYNLIMQIKTIGAQHGLCTVLASQVTKSSAKGQQNGKALDAMDARYVNDDAFNLFMTINPDRTPNGDYLPSAVFNVVKNSLGTKGKVRVAANWERLTFKDEEHFNQRFTDEDNQVTF